MCNVQIRGNYVERNIKKERCKNIEKIKDRRIEVEINIQKVF